ncbi:MAG: alpha/beta hydrolase [Pseudonocardia sp.]|nr:alpha/beta hydrolase [Pseudonocardia sp.]
MVRLRLLRWCLRLLFGLPRWLKRLLAGPVIRREGQVLDLDLQLLGRLTALVAGRGPDGIRTAVTDGSLTGAPEAEGLRRAALAEQRRQADLAAEVAAEPGLDDVRTRDLHVPGADGPIAARLYVPPGARVGSALVVFFHGGGFVLGSLVTADPLCRLLAAQSGTRVLSVEYRLAPEFPYPAALDDAVASYRWAVEEATSLGADPGLVAVGGDSAGANLALVVAQQAVRNGDPRPASVMALYPVVEPERTGGSRETYGSGFGLTAEIIAGVERLYLPDGVPSDDLRGALLRADDLSGMPPVYLSTAGFDPLRDEGEDLVRRLRADGVPVVARRFPGLVHGYGSFTAVSAAARDATLDAASALRAALSLVASTRAASAA